MKTPEGTVYIVDDDPSVRKALARLCQSVGMTARTFATARELIEAGAPASPACLVLDLCLPDLGGLDLQAELSQRNIRTPIVFITGKGDIPTSVRAMKAGAVDFLTKPFRHEDLIGVIRDALRKDVGLHSEQDQRDDIEGRMNTLTPREREVFELVVKGLLNKQIGAELGASEQTIKVHRRRVMEKMQLDSVAELVQAAVKVGVLKT